MEGDSGREVTSIPGTPVIFSEDVSIVIVVSVCVSGCDLVDRVGLFGVVACWLDWSSR